MLKVDAVTSLVTVLAGGFYGSSGDPSGGYTGDWITAKYSTLNSPTDVCADSMGNVYIVEQGVNRVRKISSINGIISTVAGYKANTGGNTLDGSFATSSLLNSPIGVRVDMTGNVYFSEYGNDKVRIVSKVSGKLGTLAGTGASGSTGDGNAASSATINNPSFLDIDTKGDVYIVHEASASVALVRKVSMGTGLISTVSTSASSMCTRCLVVTERMTQVNQTYIFLVANSPSYPRPPPIHTLTHTHPSFESSS